MWILTTSAIRTERDFRQVVVGYAEEAAAHGAVYIEGIFTPVERVSGGASWDEVFTGFCDGTLEAKERFGVEMRLTPDTPRNFDLESAMQTARYAVKYRDRGVVGLGIGGPEVSSPPEPFEPAFRLARDGGIGSVPHAGEVSGPESVLGAIEALGANRIRHGIRAISDPGVIRELVAREIVCDVCPVSNLRTGAVRSLDEHPLGAMLDAGVLCSISTDDPAMFDTDLTREYAVAEQLGCTSKRASSQLASEVPSVTTRPDPGSYRPGNRSSGDPNSSRATLSSGGETDCDLDRQSRQVQIRDESELLDTAHAPQPREADAPGTGHPHPGRECLCPIAHSEKFAGMRHLTQTRGEIGGSAYVVVAVDHEDLAVGHASAQTEDPPVVTADHLGSGCNRGTNFDSDEHCAVAEPFGDPDAAPDCKFVDQGPEARDRVDRRVLPVGRYEMGESAEVDERERPVQRNDTLRQIAGGLHATRGWSSSDGPRVSGSVVASRDGEPQPGCDLLTGRARLVHDAARRCRVGGIASPDGFRPRDGRRDVTVVLLVFLPPGVSGLWHDASRRSDLEEVPTHYPCRV